MGLRMAESDVKISALPAASALAGGEEFAAVQGGATVRVSADQVAAYTAGSAINSAIVLLYQRTSSSSAPPLPSAAATFTFATGVITGVDNGWTTSLPTSGGAYRWQTSAQARGAGATDVITPAEWAAVASLAQDGAAGAAGATGAAGTAGAAGAAGAAGTNGLNNAVVLIYQRSPGAPSNPSATSTYTFATGGITGLNNGWAATIPAGTDPLYVTSATASASGTTDTIAAGEWSTAVILATNGTAGLNAATIYLFQRTTTAVAPALPSATVTYTFATGVATGVNNGWVSSVPSSGGAYLWTTTATALGTGATDTIGSSEWATASTLAQDGAPGAAGTPGSAGATGAPGAAGANAPLLSLSFTGIAFTFDAGGTAIPSSQTISATAVLQNVGGTATFLCTLYNAAGTSLSTPTMGGSGNTRTLTSAQFGAAAYAVISASLSGLSDTQTVIRVSNGADSFAFELTNDNHTLPADSAGHVTDYTGATSTLIVLRAGADDSSNWTFSKVDSTGVTSSISANVVTDTALADANDTGYIDITASRSGYTSVTKRFTLTKSKSAVMASSLNQAIGTVTATWSSSPHTLQANAAIRLNSDGYIYARQGNSTATYASTGIKFDNASSFTGTYYAQYDLLTQSGGATLGGTGGKSKVNPTTIGIPVTLQVTNGTGDVTLVCTIYDSTGGNKLAIFNVTLHVDSAD